MKKSKSVDMTIEELAQSIADGNMGTDLIRELALAGMIASHYGLKGLSWGQSFDIIDAFRDAVEKIVEEAETA